MKWCFKTIFSHISSHLLSSSLDMCICRHTNQTNMIIQDQIQISLNHSGICRKFRKIHEEGDSETSMTSAQEWGKQSWQSTLTQPWHSYSRRAKWVHVSSQVITARSPWADPGCLVEVLNDSHLHLIWSPGNWQSHPVRIKATNSCYLHLCGLHVKIQRVERTFLLNITSVTKR